MLVQVNYHFQTVTPPGHKVFWTRMSLPTAASRSQIVRPARKVWWNLAPMHTTCENTPNRDGETERAVPQESTRLRILVVEDEAIVALDLMSVLEQLGHSVVGHAYSGEEAVQAAVSQQPDLILMDIRLQGVMDGIQAARHIRARYSGIRVLFLTAFVDDDTLRQVKSMGFGQPLRKPYSTHTLKTAIERELH